MREMTRECLVRKVDRNVINIRQEGLRATTPEGVPMFRHFHL